MILPAHKMGRRDLFLIDLSFWITGIATDDIDPDEFEDIDGDSDVDPVTGVGSRKMEDVEPATFGKKLSEHMSPQSHPGD